MTILRSAVLWSICALPTSIVLAQEAPAKPFVFGEVRDMRSPILQQDRVLNVHLPDGYADSTAHYPVIYVLDGSANEDFPHIAGLVQFMNMYDLLPKSIVVGIANVGRSRYHDFTSPTTSDSDRVWVPTGGGSAAFMDHITSEVKPFVAKHYRTTGRSTIIGQSLGGLLATEILLTRPELFDDYILVSPSLWWNKGALAANAEDRVKVLAALPKRVFIAVAQDDDMMQAEVDRLVQALAAHAAPQYTWSYKVFSDETHATVLHRAVYDAFVLFGAGRSR